MNKPYLLAILPSFYDFPPNFLPIKWRTYSNLKKKKKKSLYYFPFFFFIIPFFHEPRGKGVKLENYNPTYLVVAFLNQTCCFNF